MDYFLKANGLVILWIVFYYLFLKNETFFNSIRMYFLVGLLFILSIPLIEIPIYIEKTISNINYSIIEGATTINTTIEQPTDWLQLLTVIYLVGVVFFTVKFIIQLLSLGRLITLHKTTQRGNYKMVETDEDISPFSFFNYIIYNPSQFTENELKQIIKHEKTHVKQWHSIDTLLTYILQIAFWFNPFAWGYKKGTQENLEFLADVSASELTCNLKQYQFTLLKTSNTNYCKAITNNFYNSLIKKRILMLQKHKSNNSKQWKFTLLLPLIAIFLMSFSTKKVNILSNATSDIKTNNELVSDVIKITINKNTTDAELEEIKKNFSKQGADFSYIVVHNAKNEITAIDVTLKVNKDTTKLKSSASYDNDNQAIKPIHIIYNQESSTIKINSEGNIQLIDEDIELSSHSINKKNDLDEEIIEVIEESNSKSEWKVISDKNNEKKNDSLSKWKVSAISKNDIVFLNTPYKNTMFNTYEDTLYIIDGKESTKLIFENLDKNTINSISIINDSGTLAFGNKGKNGVIMVTTNKTGYKSSTDELSSSLLYIVNGQVSSKEVSEMINPDDIKSVDVLKGKSATDKYGDKGKNGAVEINTKSNNNNNNNTIKFQGKDPLIILDGKEISKKEMEKIASDNIKSMNVLKDKNATKKYGKKGKNGVIEITLKKE